MRRNTQYGFHYFHLLMSVILVTVALIWLTGCHIEESDNSALREQLKPAEEETSSAGGETALPQADTVYVHVCGKVNAPGVYELPAGSRVCDALEAAGGMTDDAAFESLNQAEPVADGQQIYVPDTAEAEQEKSVSEALEDGKVNINTASKEELTALSGIGEVKAEAILRYREEKGGFSTIEELKDVEGIKEGVFNRIKGQVKTE